MWEEIRYNIKFGWEDIKNNIILFLIRRTHITQSNVYAAMYQLERPYLEFMIDEIDYYKKNNKSSWATPVWMMRRPH